MLTVVLRSSSERAFGQSLSFTARIELAGVGFGLLQVGVDEVADDREQNAEAHDAQPDRAQVHFLAVVGDVEDDRADDDDQRSGATRGCGRGSR